MGELGLCLDGSNPHVKKYREEKTAAAAGQCLPMIGKVFCHSQVATTARYAHLAANPVKGADHVSSAIANPIFRDREDKTAVER
jgi:hypothetical protein